MFEDMHVASGEINSKHGYIQREAWNIQLNAAGKKNKITKRAL